MIIGNGLLAKAFSKKILDDDILIFASGVSDSNTTDENSFKREFNLISDLMLNNKSKKLVYFSSVFTDDIDNPYFNHKKEIENHIIENHKDFYIFRLPQIVGFGGNSNNIINLFVNNILSNTKITIWETKRCIIDIEDIVEIVELTIKNKTTNKVYNISEIECISVSDIVKIIEEILNKKALIDIVDKKTGFSIPNSLEIEEIINDLNFKRDGYIKKILRKYVKHK